MKLCVDVGNTTINLGYYKDDTLINKVTFDTHKSLDKEYYVSKFATDDVSDIIYSSVVPSLNELLFEILRTQYQGASIVTLDNNIDHGVIMNIDNPSELGSDLIADIVGAIYKYPLPCLVVDLGTAIKFLYVDENKVFQSALITPGIKLSVSSLFKDAELLPEIDYTRKDTLKVIQGKNTIDSITSGIIIGHLKMIEGIVNDFALLNKNKELNVIITGGDMDLFKPYLVNNIDYHFDDRLVLDGELLILNKLLKERGNKYE